jgi:hypothetical protein
MSLLFCLDIVKPLSLRPGLLLSYMLGLNCLLLCVSMFLLFFCFFPFKKKKKKKGGRKLQIFIPVFSFSDILCIFT